MHKYTQWHLLLVASLSLGCPRLAHAQADKLSSTTYGFADQLPALPQGGGAKALEAAIQANFHFPADAPRAQQLGVFRLNVIVSAKGQVADIQPYGTTGIKPSVAAAAVAAVRQLPRLTPALVNGQPVQFSFRVQVTLTGQPGSPLLASEMHLSAPPDLSNLSGGGSSPPVESIAGERTYTYVEQMPALPDGASLQVISETIRQRLVIPHDLAEGIVYVSFVVNENGDLTEPAIVKGASPDADAAVLAALRKLPHFTPGKQNSRPVNVKLTIRVPVLQPKAPAPKAGTPPTRKPR